jgi:hypothetical protein
MDPNSRIRFLPPDTIPSLQRNTFEAQLFHEDRSILMGYPPSTIFVSASPMALLP